MEQWAPSMPGCPAVALGKSRQRKATQSTSEEIGRRRRWTWLMAIYIVGCHKGRSLAVVRESQDLKVELLHILLVSYMAGPRWKVGFGRGYVASYLPLVM
jgi:hypothetical protein